MTARWPREVAADVVGRIATAPNVFLFLDYDGTLAPLAPTPDAAQPLPATPALLQDLAAWRGTQVAVVTGRSVTDIRCLLDVPGIYYVGIHGLEIRLPNGTVELSESVAVVRSVLPAIKHRIERAVGHRPGILIEDKGLALAVHFRLAARADAAFARAAVATAAEPAQRQGAPIAVLHGHEVVEIRSALANKGKTVCQLLAAYAPAALAVYIGDDQTDEDAFRLLPPQAITIRVGPATMSTAARYCAASPHEVLRFLRAVLDQRHTQESAIASGCRG